MNYDELEAEINKIIELAEKLPEKYRVACFEILVSSAIRGNIPQVEAPVASPEAKPQEAAKIELPIDVKAFLMQYTLPDEAIDKLFLRKGSEIRPIYKITEESKFKAQIQIALLSALENALKSPDTKFEFSYEHVRELCKRHNRYDTDHFKQTFTKNKKLFVSLTDEEHVEISPDGKGELADLVAELAK